METGTSDSRVEYYSRYMGWNNIEEEEFVYDRFEDEDYGGRGNAGNQNSSPSTGVGSCVVACGVTASLIPVLFYTRKQRKKRG